MNWYDELEKKVHELDGLDAGLRYDIGSALAELRHYRKEFLSEERKAWDAYAAAYSISYADENGKLMAAKYADRLLAERRTRFGEGGHKA